jgi:hypothetical protein
MDEQFDDFSCGDDYRDTYCEDDYSGDIDLEGSCYDDLYDDPYWWQEEALLWNEIRQEMGEFDHQEEEEAQYWEEYSRKRHWDRDYHKRGW